MIKHRYNADSLRSWAMKRFTLGQVDGCCRRLSRLPHAVQ